jgi:RNA polymerase sigma-70 factor (ECF subfamily)
MGLKRALGSPSSSRVALLPGAAGDRALVARMQAGGEQAYRDCYEAHAPKTMSLLVRMLGDREKAEEILQETFVAVFRKIGQYRGDARFGTWITGIAIRRALNARRDDSRRIPTVAPSKAIEAVTVDESGISSRDLARRLLALLNRLQDEKRIALLLYAEGYTAAEIAAMTNAPRATVLARIARGRAELLSLAASAGVAGGEGRLEGSNGG